MHFFLWASLAPKAHVTLQRSYHRYDPPDSCDKSSPAHASGGDRCDYGRVGWLHFPRANFTWTVYAVDVFALFELMASFQLLPLRHYASCAAGVLRQRLDV